MNPILLRILGVSLGEGGSVVGTRLEFHPALGGAALAALAVPALAAAIWSYRRRGIELSPARRGVLLGLRLLGLLAVVGILLRPALGLTVDGLVRQVLVLLFDQSASLALRDPRTDPADQLRADIAAGRVPATGGLDRGRPVAAPGGGAPARLDLLRAAITNRELDLVNRLGTTFDLKVAGFTDDLVALDVPGTGAATNAAPSYRLAAGPLAASLRAEGARSAPGTALRELLDRERGRPLGGVVVFTDGIRNAGLDPVEAAGRAREAGVPLHFVGLGTTAPRDLQVVEVTSPEVAFVRDEVPVAARLRVRGLAGQPVRVSLLLDGQRMDEREVVPDADGEALVALKFTPESTGDFELSVEVPARPDEILAENNRWIHRLRVIDDRIRVLLLEQSPRWEFRYLQALLLRDRRVDLKCVLFDGDPAIARSPGSPYLESFPAQREDLFGFDLIVFGDIEPRNFTPAQLESLAEFVARSGGSFLMLAGRRFSPWSYRDTPLERLLPVEFDRLSAPPVGGGGPVHDRPLKVVLTPSGRESPLLRIAEEPAENARRWEGLPPLFWVAPVARAKPAAEVLLVEASQEGTAPIPVLALQQYGVGQSMFVGTDNTWRWRRNDGEAFFVSFWGRIVQRLAIQHLLSGSRRTQLVLDRLSVLPGQSLGFTGRLFNRAFEPLTDPVVRARVEGEGGASRDVPPAEILLRSVPDQPGVYRGEWVAGTPGRYRITVGDEAPAMMDFTVEDRLIEAGETALQDGLLRDLAAATGGGFFREEDLHRLPDVARSKAQRVESRLTVDLWSSPLYYLVVLGLFGAEWALRKIWRLK